MNRFAKKAAFWAIAVISLVALLWLLGLASGPGPGDIRQVLAYSDFLGEVERARIADVVVSGSRITGHFSNGSAFETYVPTGQDVVRRLLEKNVRVSALPGDDVPSWGSLLQTWLPYILAWVLWWYLIVQPIRALAASLATVSQNLQQIAGRVDSQSPPSSGNV